MKNLYNYNDFINEGKDLMESASDSLKLQYVTKTHQDFVTNCKRNFKGIVDDLFSEGYHTYKVKELTISISIDDLLNASGDSAVGQYDDETRELSITLFPVLQKIKYGSGYIGIGMIDDLEEITDEERDIYIGIIKDALTNPRSVEFGKIKAKFGGSSAGHNGIASIDKFIGKDYSRVRIGIGKPKENIEVGDFVLQNFDEEELAGIEKISNNINASISLLVEKKLDLFSSTVNNNK